MADQSNEQSRSSPASAIATRLAMGYIASQAISVATRLGIADLLSKGALTSSEISRSTETQADTMHRLLRALAAFDVVKDLGWDGSNSRRWAIAFASNSPNSVRPLVLLFGSESFWQTFASLDACIKTGQNAYQILHGLESSFAYYEKHPDLARVFDDAMSAGSALIGAIAARTYDFSGIGRVVDVGGGHGKVLASILKANPNLRGTLFDLPAWRKEHPLCSPGKGLLTAARPWAGTCLPQCRLAAMFTCCPMSSTIGMTLTLSRCCRCAAAPWHRWPSCSFSTE